MAVVKIHVLSYLLGVDKALVVRVEIKNELTLANGCRVVWVVDSVLKLKIEGVEGILKYVKKARRLCTLNAVVEGAKQIFRYMLSPRKGILTGSSDLV